MTKDWRRLDGGVRDLSWRIAGLVVTALLNDRVESTFTRTTAQAVILAAVTLVPPAVSSAGAGEPRNTGTTTTLTGGVAPRTTDQHDRATSGATGAAYRWRHGCNHPHVVHNVLVIAVRDVWQSPSVEPRTPPGGSSASGTWPVGALMVGAQDGLHLSDHDPYVVYGVEALELPGP